MAGIGSARPASTSARKAGSACASAVASKPHPRELPARRRREEVAVGGAAVAARGGAAGALQHHLTAHELAIILADRALGGLEAGIGEEGAHRPLPDVAEQAAAGFRHDRPSRIELVAEPRIGAAREIL